MSDEQAARTILRMLEDLPFYEDERQALQAAVIALQPDKELLKQ